MRKATRDMDVIDRYTNQQNLGLKMTILKTNFNVCVEKFQEGLFLVVYFIDLLFVIYKPINNYLIEIINCN